VLSVPENRGSHQSTRPVGAEQSQAAAGSSAPHEVVALVAAAMTWWRQIDVAGRQIHGRRYVPGSAQIGQLTRLLRSDTRRVSEALRAGYRKPQPAAARAAGWVQL
jgi:hypothetical protein